MQDIDKSKEQLTTEVTQLRQRIAELEAAETGRKQVEDALRKSEEKYRTVVEISPDGIAIASKGRHVFANKSLARIFGVCSPEELVGKPLMDYIHPDYRKIVKERLEQQTKRGEVAPLIEEKMLRADGTVIDTEVAAAPLRYEGEEAVLAVIRDITKRKVIEEALRESEERYHSLFKNSQDAILLTAPDGSIFDVNPAACQMFGRTAEEIKQLGRDGLVDPTDPRLGAALEERTRKGKARAEITMIRADGTRFLADITSTIFDDEQGRQRTSMIIRNISERKRIEEALRKSEERYRTVVDNIDLGINLIDSDHNIIMVNATMEERFNKPVSEIIGKKCFREFEKRSVICRHCPGVQTMTTGRSAEVETEGVRDDGSRFHVRLQTFPVISQGGGASAFIEIAEDITDRKRIEEALRESEEKYRSLVESSENSIYLVDEECTYLFMNKRHLSRIGVPSSQVVGKAYSAFHSPEETKDFARKVKKVLKTGESLSYEYKSQRDNRYFIRTLSPVKASKSDKPSAITVISKDITELKQSEDTLREREAFNFALFQYNPVETIVVDIEGRVTGFNLAKAKSNDRLPVIGDTMYKDYASRHEIDMHGELMKCIKSGKAKEFPDRKYSDRYLSITISPFSEGAIIISEDITKRKRAEELLQRERDTFFSILQKAPYGVVFLDNEGKTILINIEFTTITGYSHEDIPTLKDWFRLAYPDKKYRDTVTDILTRDIAVSRDDKIFYETYHRTFFRTFKITCKDGTIKEIEFRPTALEDGATIVMIADITERKRIHDLLETAAAEWRTTFDAINDAVMLLDLTGKIKRCNNSMVKVIGKPFSEIVDRPYWEVVHDVSKPPKECLLESVRKSHRRETEVFTRANRWLNATIDPMLDDDGHLLGAVHILSDITERMSVEEELHKSREELRNLTVYLESVREQERTSIAREIHDELAQSLTALKMDLAWLDNKFPRDQIPLLEKIHSMSELIDSIIQTVKRISAALRPGILDDLGLVAAIEWQAEEFQNRTGIKCRFAVNPDDLTVDQDRTTAIFRIFQETLTNIARHAGASLVSVELLKEAGLLILRVIDNGTGITEEQIHDSKSFGLIGMRERVHPWGGLVNIKGIPGQGTTVEVRIPLKKR
ncbi:MAG: PAS domain S-box protein [Deltaproteobacteria bacterium]|nr:PAS domain S-box protein [Deltaproteobacteria bacterium]